jgi:putative transposase
LDGQREHRRGADAPAGSCGAPQQATQVDHAARAGRWRAPDLVKRDFAAERINQKWYGDATEIRTGEGKLHLASILDMGSRRVVGFALSEHHNAELAYGVLAMAVAVRGGSVPSVIMHTDCGSEYTAGLFRAACGRLQIRQSMDRPGSALDNAVIEAWHSTLTFELRAGNLRHQGGLPGPGTRLDR